ncbi:carbohydrate-binding family 9-like protein [Eubacteriales bacterium OttesenSCG-928-N13]|nr:carbohydrate-binding family 9-like protein [Eubacteriales bacterium OttesenSCG-928-N13]
MAEYIIRRGKPDDAWVACYPWPMGYEPKVRAQLTWSEHGLHVAMTAWEQTIVAKEWRMGGMVCQDSCMEFFFQPMPESDARYINIELNPLGVMHIGIGAARQGRTVIMEYPEGMRPEIQIIAGECWTARYTIRTDWLSSLFPGWAPREGMRMRGNFFKCDETIHPHFGCWHPVHTKEPDFHTPDDFGELLLAT